MFRSVTLTTVLLLTTITAHASLLGRVPLTPGGSDYQAYYDDALNITWVADGNLAATHPFGVPVMGDRGPGTMNWETAQEWIAAMNGASYLGVSDWRLTTVTDTGVPGCNLAYSGTDCGWNVDPATGEIAHLYYVTLGNIGGTDPNGVQQPCDTGMPAPPACLVNVGPFTNFLPGHYWIGTEFVIEPLIKAWEFNARIGSQNIQDKTRNSYAWAVRDGDIGPAAMDDGPLEVTEAVAKVIAVGANDTGFVDPVTVMVTTAPTQGTIGAISFPGPAEVSTITYAANIGATGIDSFVYSMVDSTAATDSATVLVNIVPVDRVPDAFDFPDQADVPLTAVITSSVITVSGINVPTTIVVTNGEYSVDQGDFTELAGTVTPASAVVVRHTSAGLPSTTTVTVVTIGGVSDIFSSRTAGQSPDGDGDGLPDASDNCSLVANLSQCDSDADGYGNHCDGDFGNPIPGNGATNAQDSVLFRAQLGRPSTAPTYNQGDLNCDGAVNAQDSVLFRALLGMPPGPSGLHP